MPARVTIDYAYTTANSLGLTSAHAVLALQHVNRFGATANNPKAAKSAIDQFLGARVAVNSAGL